MYYWLMKSEPDHLSIDDLAAMPNQTVEWVGVRNYMARNYMRDSMQLGDLALFWHSSCKNPGIYGVVEIVSKPHPDSSQFDHSSIYYDARAIIELPRWWCIDVRLVAKTKCLSIKSLREYAELSDMCVLRRGNRLSITKVTASQWQFISSKL